MRMTSAQEWLGPSETARRLGVSVSRVRQLAVVEGQLPYIKTPLGKLFAAEDVARLASTRSTQGEGVADAAR